MSLKVWLDNGCLRKHDSSKEEIASLLALAHRDVAESQTPGLSADWRLAIAYNGSLQAAAAALAAAGYQSTRENKHLRVIQSLEFTLGLDPKLVGRLEKLRKKRHQTEYERPGAVSDGEAAEMLDLARRVVDAVQAWLEAQHPDLLGPED